MAPSTALSGLCACKPGLRRRDAPDGTLAPDVCDDASRRADEGQQPRCFGELPGPREPDDPRRQPGLEGSDVERAGEKLGCEPGHERDAETGAHESLDDVVVVRAQHEVRVDAFGAKVLDHALRAPRTLEADQVETAQLDRVNGLALRGTAAGARRNEHVFVDRQWVDLHCAFAAKRKVDETGVEVSAVERREEPRVAGTIVQ